MENISGDVKTLLYVAFVLAGTFFLTTLLTCLFAGRNICLKKYSRSTTESDHKYVNNQPVAVDQPDSVTQPEPVPQSLQVPQNQQIPQMQNPLVPPNRPAPILPPVNKTMDQEEPVYSNSELPETSK